MTSAAAVAARVPAAAVPAPAISLRDVRKVYRRSVALQGLSLTVEPGEVFGFLGPNGAGKTTTIKILTGLVRATSGQACLFGVDVADPVARARVGYLPELFQFPHWLTGVQLLQLHGRLAGIDGAAVRDQIPLVLDRVGLAGRGGDRLAGYSKGMLQRIGVAQALLGEPELVLLDEPTSALDPVGRRDMRQLIRALRADGITVFLNSHLLSEVEQVCDRIAVVNRGAVVFEGSVADLMVGTATLRVTVDLVDAALLAALAEHGQVMAVEGRTVLLEAADAAAVAATVVGTGRALLALVPGEQSLEDAFIALVGGAS